MINICNLTKSFSEKIILNDLNLNIHNGEILALIGNNGAGKTTLIRLISGLLKADNGKIEIDNKNSIGVLLGGDINLYKNLTAYETIKYFGTLHGLDNNYINKRIEELNEILKFKDFINKRTNSFSRGMKQKIGFAISIIHDPQILLLDEPSTGLDIETANDVINFIKYLKTKGKTILLATHNIFEISDLSDNIAFLCDGKIKRKINTKNFFNNCPNDEKSSYLINNLKEVKNSENVFNGIEKRIT